MGVSVNSSTITTNQLFTNRFRIPEYQRPYSWKADKDGDSQIIDFWIDLNDALKDQPYFLGSMIFTVENGNDKPRDVVDGQQRLITLSLLANALRWVAKELGEDLFVSKIENDFLYALDVDRRVSVPKIEFLSLRDEGTYHSLLDDPTGESVPAIHNTQMVEAEKYFLKRLESKVLNTDGDDSESGKLNPIMYLSDWMKLLASGIELTAYEHPTDADAFKVFEIINTRGMGLTPAQMIKSYIVGCSSDKDQAVTIWSNIENEFAAINQDDQLTGFIRHVVTLDVGYVLSRDLFGKIKKVYNTPEGVDQLLEKLTSALDAYLLLVQPDDMTQQDESEILAASILSTLKITTARPLLLSVMLYADDNEKENLLRYITRLVVTRIVSGSFGTGYVESIIGSTAQKISQSPSEAMTILQSDLQELQRPQQDFVRALSDRHQSRGVLQVLLSSLTKQSSFPSIEGYVHQIRPVKVPEWTDFSEEEYAELKNTLGNTVLLDVGRRPTYKKDWKNIREVFSAHLIDNHDEAVFSEKTWNAKEAGQLRTDRIATLTEIWYE